MPLLTPSEVREEGEKALAKTDNWLIQRMMSAKEKAIIKGVRGVLADNLPETDILISKIIEKAGEYKKGDVDMARDYSKLCEAIDKHLDAANGSVTAIDWFTLIQTILTIILTIFRPQPQPLPSKGESCPQGAWDNLTKEADRSLKAATEGVCAALCMRQCLEDCKPPK